MSLSKRVIVMIVALSWSSPSALAEELAVGSAAPDFQATAPNGETISLATMADAELVVVVFTCNQCPVAAAYEDRLMAFADDFRDRRVEVIAINNSDREDLASNQQRIEEKGINYLYTYDGSGDSARGFGAQVTPHFFVLDRDRNLAYKGAFDDSWVEEPTVHYVRDVVDSLLSGERPEVAETKAIGCTIKLRR